MIVSSAASAADNATKMGLKSSAARSNRILSEQCSGRLIASNAAQLSGVYNCRAPLGSLTRRPIDGPMKVGNCFGALNEIITNDNGNRYKQFDL